MTSAGTEQGLPAPRPSQDGTAGPSRGGQEQGGRRKTGSTATDGRGDGSERERTTLATFTFEDLMDPGVPHVLLDRAVLQVAVAPVHLQGLVADLLGHRD